jgi:hypothetical protein
MVGSKDEELERDELELDEQELDKPAFPPPPRPPADDELEDETDDGSKDEELERDDELDEESAIKLFPSTKKPALLGCPPGETSHLETG